MLKNKKIYQPSTKYVHTFEVNAVDNPIESCE